MILAAVYNETFEYNCIYTEEFYDSWKTDNIIYVVWKVKSVFFKTITFFYDFIIIIWVFLNLLGVNSFLCNMYCFVLFVCWCESYEVGF